MDQTTRIGRYSLVRRVGAGAFATVWLAYDHELDAEVALKVLSDNWIDENDVRRRFVAEGRFLRRVESPHVVGVHDVGETEDGRPYLVLTYADGGSMGDRMKQRRLGVAEVVDVIGQVGAGLQQLHRRGVLHRDVKPANVLFRSEPDGGERAMLGDLGLGKSLESVSQLTMPAGTPAYVAPEQVMGDRLDQRADLYSLGAVAYAAFTGQAPHGIVSLAAAMRIETPPPAISTLRDDFPAALDAVVGRALEPDRDRRWPDLDSFLAALQSAHETGDLPAGFEPHAKPAPSATATGSATDVPPPAAVVGSEPPGRRNPARRWVVAGTLAVVLAAAGGYTSYEVMSRRPVKVTAGQLSVEVPREWSQKSDNGWFPVAGQPAQPGLLVSTDTGRWQQQATVPGVFLGMLKVSTLPTSVAAPRGCRPAPAEPGEIDGRRMVTFRFACDGSAPVVERYVQKNDTDAVRIQVRTVDAQERDDVLASATAG